MKDLRVGQTPPFWARTGDNNNQLNELIFTLFQTEPEFKLDKEEQESDPKPPLPPPNLINPIFGYCQDKNCSLCPTKSTVKIGEFFTCFPQKDDSRASCQLIHWHSKNNQCLQATEDDFK